MRVDDQEFADFVREASPGLLRAAWFLCGDHAQAEDLVQTSLEKVYRRWRRIDPGARVSYARRCLVTAHSDHYRKWWRESAVVELPDRPAPEQPVEDSTSLVRMLSVLPQRERQVVVLRHYVGLSEAQTAQMLDVSVGTVKSSASRGLSRLREHFPVLSTEEISHA